MIHEADGDDGDGDDDYDFYDADDYDDQVDNDNIIMRMTMAGDSKS